MSELNNQTGKMAAEDLMLSGDEQIEKELEEAMGEVSLDDLVDQSMSKDPELKSISSDLIRGRVSSINGDDVFIELSRADGRNTGVVPGQQFEHAPQIGAVMEFAIQRWDEAQGFYVLAREGAASGASWDQMQKGSTIEARVTATNKGGLELELPGKVNAFMPISQVDIYHVDDIEPFVGKKLTAIVQEIDRKSKRVLVSRRAYLEKEREIKAVKLWETIAVDQELEGTVTKVMEFGAFVDIGGADGLIHISDLSYTRVDKPEDVIKVGDKVTAKVLKLEKEKGRIGLGLKQIQPNPWDSLDSTLAVGETVSGRIVRILDFGAFVEIMPGVEGLLPNSEISWKRIGKPSEVVSVNQVVQLVVLEIDLDKQRVKLSMKQCQGDPWVGAERQYAEDTMVVGTIQSILDFGAFAEVAPGIEGLVHISELSTKRVKRVEDVVSVGKSYEFRILDVDEDDRRMRLSLKPKSDIPNLDGPSNEEIDKAVAEAKAKLRDPKDLSGGMGNSGAMGMGLGSLKL